MSARLIGRTGTVRGLDQPVSEMLTLGSGDGSQLRIDSRTVSRQHAQIVKIGTDYYVEDLSSRNGTFLNGERVKRFPVRHLDVLSIGPDVDLIFLEGGAATPLVERRATLKATVLWLDGPLAGQVEEVRADRGLLLGRRPELEKFGAISRRQAVLTIRDDRVTIEDLGSANGTWVNGAPITSVTPLADGQEASLANLVRVRLSILGVAGRLDSQDVGLEQDPQTVAVDRPSRRQGPPLERPPSSVPRPLPTPPSVAVAPETQRQGSAEVPPAVEVPPAIEAAGTIAAPREPAITPPEAARGRAVPGDTFQSVVGDATTAAPREALAVPQFEMPIALSDADPLTFAEPRESAGGVPMGVSNQARVARDAVGETEAAPLDERPVGPAATPSRPQPARTVTGSYRITGLRLEGPQDVKLNCGTFLVGRHAECDVHIDAWDVGRRHARLHVREDRVTVEDFATANGTFVNDQPVTGETEVPDGSDLRFATVAFTVIYFRTEGQTP